MENFLLSLRPGQSPHFGGWFGVGLGWPAVGLKLVSGWSSVGVSPLAQVGVRSFLIKLYCYGANMAHDSATALLDNWLPLLGTVIITLTIYIPCYDCGSYLSQHRKRLFMANIHNEQGK